MFLSTPFSVPAFLMAAALTVAFAQGALVVSSFGPGSGLPAVIGDTTISYVFTPESEGYYKFGITADQGGFGRFQDSSNNCYYWFRSTDAEGFDGTTLNLVDIYSTTYGVAGPTELTSSLVDGALWSDDNYISYYNAGGTMIAILRFAFTEGTEDMQLVSMAVDTEGITFGDGIRASASIPEPSVILSTLLAAGMGFTRRRR